MRGFHREMGRGMPQGRCRYPGQGTAKPGREVICPEKGSFPQTADMEQTVLTHGEKNGIAILTIEEQQLLFKSLSKESYQVFRKKQLCLFGEILESFGIKADTAKINLFTNLSLTAMVIRRAIPDTLPFFVPEAAEETMDFQLNAIVDALEKLKTAPHSEKQK